VWASLQQRCNNCGWRGEPREPEQLAIRDTQTVNVGRFGGYEYTAYDKYGHVVVYSRSYKTREEAEKDIASELARSKNDKERGPYTVVLWPVTVVVKGEVFKVDGELK
jgi:hypothetical protein